jgi:RNA polymerase sigma-70 factor (ECF subfamily)
MQDPKTVSPASSPSSPASSNSSRSLWERRAFEKQLMGVIPDLRAFARFLAGNPAEADDLVQDTVVRALNAYEHFDLKTNIKAWTFTILRNIRINSYRKRRFEELDEATMATMSARANQEDSLELKEVLRALETLPAAQREVITLVRASGLSYEEAAEIMGCKLGTIKSRVNRADAALRAALGSDFRAPRASSRNASEAAELSL